MRGVFSFGISLPGPSKFPIVHSVLTVSELVHVIPMMISGIGLCLFAQWHDLGVIIASVWLMARHCPSGACCCDPCPPLVTAHPMWWPSSWCQLCGPAWREHNDIRELLDSSNAVTQTLVNTRGALHQWTDYTSSCILRLILLPRLFSRSTLKLVQSAVYTASCIFHSDSFIFVQINPKTSSKCSGHFILCLILLHRLWNDDGVSGRLV